MVLKDVVSPNKGKAFMLCNEAIARGAIEALRYIEYLKEGGLALINSRVMHPPVETAVLVKDRAKKHFTLEEVVSRVKRWTSRAAVIDALAAAKESGNPNAENTVPRMPLGAEGSPPGPGEGEGGDSRGRPEWEGGSEPQGVRDRDAQGFHGAVRLRLVQGVAVTDGLPKHPPSA